MPAWLGEDRATSIVESLDGPVGSGGTFSCHKTVNYNNDDDAESEYTNEAGESHCAGAIIMQEKEEASGGRVIGQMLRIAERFGLYKRGIMDVDSDKVFDTRADFIQHHSR
jgi:hypothetical protein